MSKKKVIGYVGTRNLGKMREEDIQKLDVINIAFGHIRDSEVVWEEGVGREAELERIRRIHPEIKIILSVGGWSADGFSQAAMTETSREKAAKSAAALVDKYRLDGIDIDWEYPCFALAGIAADRRDKENFTLFLEKLRQELDTLGEGRMLTIAAGGDSYFTQHTDMAQAQRYLDYVQLMTYDLQGGFVKVTGHHASLYAGTSNLFDVCVDKAVKVFQEAGVPAEKLVVGVPFYARVWKEVKGGGDGLGREAGTVGVGGPGYKELAEKYIDKNGYRRYWDDAGKAPYLFNGDCFISYDDGESLRAKTDYVLQKGLGGIMFWEYGCDPDGTLLNYIYEGFRA